MLLGEHAVLYHRPALCCAINQYITLSLYKRHDEKIIIHSTQLGEHETTLSTLRVVAPFSFVLATITYFANKLSSGFFLKIDADFSPNLGLGSSAAVTVASVVAVSKLVGERLSQQALIIVARRIIRSLQKGLGSGADVAASVLGGIIYYRATPLVNVRRQLSSFPLVVVYSGQKKATTAIIEPLYQSYHANDKKRRWFEALYDQICHCVLHGYMAIVRQDWQTLGAIFNAQQKIMLRLGVSHQLLENMIHQLRQLPHIYGAKLSGAGLGDSIIAIANPRSMPQFTVNTTPEKQGIKPLRLKLSSIGMSDG